MGKRAMVALALVGVVVAAAWGQTPAQDVEAAVELELPPRPDNAAVNYLTACTILPQPWGEKERDAIDFIEDDLQWLPPEALEGQEEALYMLDGGLRTVGFVACVHEGAEKDLCMFDVTWEDGLTAGVPYLSAMRRLTRWTSATATCAEFRKDHARAVEICSDAMRMGEHVAQNCLAMDGLVGAAIQAITLGGIEGWLSREPPAKDVATLLQNLYAATPQPSRIGKHVQTDIALYAYSMAHSPAQELLATLKNDCGGPEDERFKALSRLTEDDFKKHGARWLDEYREMLKRIVALSERPYLEAAQALKEEEARVARERETFVRDPRRGNFFIAVCAERYIAVVSKRARMQAQLDAVRIACAALLYKQDKGGYPTKISELAAYFADGLPRNPQTGADYEYMLMEGLPSIAYWTYTGEPVGVRIFTVDLHERRIKDAQALARFRAKR